MKHHLTLGCAAVIVASALALGGCPRGPNYTVETVDTQTIVLQQPVVVQQPRPVVVQQPRPVVVQQPRPVVVRRPAGVMTPVRVSVPAQVAARRSAAALSTGSISYPHQRLRYPLVISTHQTVTIYVDGHNLDPTVAVYDPSGRRIGFNDDGGSGLDSRLTLTLHPGTYAVEVAGYSTSTGSFTLSVH